MRGQSGSQLSAMGFGTYAPNPAFFGTTVEAFEKVSLSKWFMSEMFTTSILVFGILFLTDQHNTSAPSANLAPFFIGLLVAALVAYEAPISMTAMNPARDLGPRIMSYAFGWGEMAFPGPRGGWWIPTVSTITGGLIAGAFYRWFYRGAFETYDTETPEWEKTK
jgi:glycerol uptake facilitator protein